MRPLPLELLLTSPAGFGLTTATPLQRAICRIIDGAPLGELASHPDVVNAVGDVESLPVGVRPSELLLLAAIRCAKSMMGGAVAVRSTQTCDVSGLGPGETPRVAIVSLKLDLGRVVLDHIVGTLNARPRLKSLIVGEPTVDSVTLRHPSGRPIEIKLVPLDRAAGSLVSRWLAAVVFDESPRMVGADGGVANLSEARRSVIGRLLPGGQIIDIGSAWAPFGPIYELVQEHWGHPTDRLVVIRANGEAMNPVYWNPERVARIRKHDPQAARTDLDCEFAEPEEALLSMLQLDDITRSESELEPESGAVYVGAIDPATRGNSWTLAIVQVALGEGGAPFYPVVLTRQWTGSRSAPLDPEVVFHDIAPICGRYRIWELHTDQGAGADALRSIARKEHIALKDTAVTQSLKLELFENMRTLVATGATELSSDRQVRSDLLAVRKRVTQQSVTIVLPRTADGRHADYAPAIALALFQASRTPTSYTFRLRRRRSAFGPVRAGYAMRDTGGF